MTVSWMVTKLCHFDTLRALFAQQQSYVFMEKYWKLSLNHHQIPTLSVSLEKYNPNLPEERGQSFDDPSVVYFDSVIVVEVTESVPVEIFLFPKIRTEIYFYVG